jgi:hypothetical protein
VKVWLGPASRLTVLAASLFAPSLALAEARPFLFAHTATTVKPNTAELETWLDYLNRTKASDIGHFDFTLGPRFSPVRGFEIAALTAFRQDIISPLDGPSSSFLYTETVEARWLALKLDPVVFSLLLELQIGLGNDTRHHLAPALAAATTIAGFTLSAQIGFSAAFGIVSSQIMVLRSGVAYALPLGPRWATIQLGLELYSQVVAGGFNELNGEDSTVNLGPTLSLKWKRLWFTAGVLFGATASSPEQLARFMVGLAL